MSHMSSRVSRPWAGSVSHAVSQYCWMSLISEKICTVGESSAAPGSGGSLGDRGYPWGTLLKHPETSEKTEVGSSVLWSCNIWGIGLVGIKSTKCCILRMDHIMCSGIFWSDPIMACKERTCASMIPRHSVVVHAHSLSNNVVTTFWLLHTGREPPLGLSLSKTRASSSKFHMSQVSSRIVWCSRRRKEKIKCWLTFLSMDTS